MVCNSCYYYYITIISLYVGVFISEYRIIHPIMQADCTDRQSADDGLYREAYQVTSVSLSSPRAAAVNSAF